MALHGGSKQQTLIQDPSSLVQLFPSFAGLEKAMEEADFSPSAGCDEATYSIYDVDPMQMIIFKMQIKHST